VVVESGSTLEICTVHPMCDRLPGGEIEGTVVEGVTENRVIDKAL
jgi:hypothetical protein